MSMRNIVLGACLTLLLTGCGSSPAEKKAEAEARLTQEKTKTMQEYKECIKRAKNDTAKLDSCERMLKVLEVDSQNGSTAAP